MTARMLDSVWGTIVARRLSALGVAIAAATMAAGCTATPTPSETPTSSAIPGPSASSEDSDGWVPFDSLNGGIHGRAPDNWAIVGDWIGDIGFFGTRDFIAFAWPSEGGRSEENQLEVLQTYEDWSDFSGYSAHPDFPGSEAIIVDAGYPAYWVPPDAMEVVHGGVSVWIEINVDGNISYVEAISPDIHANPGFEDDVRRFVSLLTFTDPQQ